jgi:hypothetical protein
MPLCRPYHAALKLLKMLQLLVSSILLRDKLLLPALLVLRMSLRLKEGRVRADLELMQLLLPESR